MDKEVICSKCGSIYQLSYTRTITRDKDSMIECTVCGQLLYSWNAKLLKKGSK